MVVLVLNIFSARTCFKKCIRKVKQKLTMKIEKELAQEAQCFWTWTETLILNAMYTLRLKDFSSVISYMVYLHYYNNTARLVVMNCQ